MKFSEDEEELMDRITRAVLRRGLEVPAIFMLESMKPLSFVGSQAMHFFAPLVGAIYAGPIWDRTARLLEKRESLEALIVRIEAGVEAPEPDAEAPEPDVPEDDGEPPSEG